MFNESEHSPIYEPGEWMRLLESILSNANDAILVAEAVPGDEPGPRIIYANESFTRMTGYAPDEVIGKTPRLLQGENTDRERLDEIHRALSNWESVRVEVINYRKDGSEFWVELNIAPVVNESGRVTHWVSVQREITERRRIQISLEESERRFRSVVQNSQEIIKITDADGTLRYASPAFERVFGYSSEKAVGINILDYVHQDDLARIQEEIKSALERSGGPKTSSNTASDTPTARGVGWRVSALTLQRIHPSKASWSTSGM
jgi:PAS domain S-box-containing protein